MPCPYGSLAPAAVVGAEPRLRPHPRQAADLATFSDQGGDGAPPLREDRISPRFPNSRLRPRRLSALGPPLAAHPLPPELQAVEVEVDDGRRVERQRLADEEAADDGAAQRAP